MLSTLVIAAVLSCRTVSPPPTTVACEGADRVSRNHDGLEVRRERNACTTTRCEGADEVRRTSSGLQVKRVVNACTQVRCEAGDVVRRTLDGVVLSRTPSACQTAITFGLTAR